MRSEMAATRENVLAAITQYVVDHKRRAPAKAIAEIVGDTLPNVQAIVKSLVKEGAIESSRGRNGGAKPVASDSDVAASSDAINVSEDVSAQFAALIEQIDGMDNNGAIEEQELEAAVG